MGTESTSDSETTEKTEREPTDIDSIETKPNIKPAVARNISLSQSSVVNTSGSSESSRHRRKKKKPRSKSTQSSSYSRHKTRIINNQSDARTHINKHKNKNKTDKNDKNESLREMFKQKYTQRPVPVPSYKYQYNHKQKNSTQNANTDESKSKSIPKPKPKPKSKPKPKPKSKSKAISALALKPIYSRDDGEQYDESMKTDGQNNMMNPLRMIDEHSQNIWNIVYDGDCSNIIDCVAIQRMIRVLRWYSNVHGDGDRIWEKIKDRKYATNLISDYHHVMHCHLDKENTQKTEILHQYKIVTPCDHTMCHGYKRKHFKSNDSDFNHVPFYVSCLDNIHCQFMH